MIRISQIKLKPGEKPEKLEEKIKKILKLDEKEAFRYEVVKRSIDARKKPEIYYSYTVDVSGPEEAAAVKRSRSSQVSIAEPVQYHFPEPDNTEPDNTEPVKRPVIIGTGPAGLFCGYMLALHGCRPILLERGMDVDRRLEEVERFWKDGRLNPDCNVQFGEGGAGTFSDGKLNTLVKDRDGRNREVLSIFVKAGAPESILYDGKPHIGTDILMDVVKNMRREIISRGGQVCFDTKVTDIGTEGKRVKSVTVQRGQKTERMEAETVVLAIGHSARDTFGMLYDRQVPMEAKAFAVGLRTEHPQRLISRSQYGMETAPELPPASYKLTAQTGEDRGVYSFCMCPGGYVVNASSEDGRLAVNGMSYSARDGSNANSAIIVSVTPEDYGSSHPLAGVDFQRRLEEKAYRIGGGRVPVERYGEFKEHVRNQSSVGEKDWTQPEKIYTREMQVQPGEEYQPRIKGQWQFAPVHDIMPDSLNRAFVEGMEHFNRIIPGFAADGVFLSGIESRTSSPVRIWRDEEGQSEIRGLYPCGEGAGYAGGIMSAAMDGVRTAERIAVKYKAVQEKQDGNKTE